MTARYQMIAIDLDGTLLDRSGNVGDADVDAIARARDAGVVVTICTGRGLLESARILEAIDQTDPVIVASGAMIACPQSNDTLHSTPMCPDLTSQLVRRFSSHGHAVLVLKDPSVAGHDYIVVSETGIDGVDPITRWWFDRMGVRIRCVAAIEEDEHPDHSVRVAICGTHESTSPAAEEVRSEFAEHVSFHHFGAVTPTGDPADEIVLLETFDRSVNKWSGIVNLAATVGCDASRVATIGNDVNDLVMLRESALGIAVENAVPEALEHADRVTLDNDSGGVAHAIDQILSGAW